MASYDKRRRDWVMAKSLEAVGWKSPAAFFGKVGGLALFGLLAFFALPGTDLAIRALYSAGIAVGAGLMALGCLLAWYWVAAPAALDAERETEIASLKEKLEESDPKQFATPPPYGITQTAAARMIDVLRNKKMPVQITVDNGAHDARNLFQQVVAVFREAGWNVSTFDTVGIKPPPECGVSLLRAPGVSDDHIGLVREALRLGGIDYVECEAGGDLTVPHLAFSKRDPFWVPPAKWG